MNIMNTTELTFSALMLLVKLSPGLSFDAIDLIAARETYLEARDCLRILTTEGWETEGRDMYGLYGSQDKIFNLVTVFYKGESQA
jgi:hypothetical protein